MKTLKRHSGAEIPVRVPATLLIAVFLFLIPALACASSLHEAVRDHIEAHMPWAQGTTRIDFISAEPDLSAAGDDLVFRIETAGAANFVGNAVFIARIYTNGAFSRTETVRTRIEVLRDEVVAARAVRSGSILTGEDLRLVKRWSLRIMPDAVSDLNEAIGKRLTSQLRAGAALSARMLRDAPLVRKGQMVRVLFDNGSMQISTIGMPEEDGAAGGMVRIRNLTSNKIIYAKVLGDSLVGVDI
jgi:flagella basal body P-ring formation protein FlgA